MRNAQSNCKKKLFYSNFHSNDIHRIQNIYNIHTCMCISLFLYSTWLWFRWVHNSFFLNMKYRTGMLFIYLLSFCRVFAFFQQKKTSRIAYYINYFNFISSFVLLHLYKFYGIHTNKHNMCAYIYPYRAKSTTYSIRSIVYLLYIPEIKQIFFYSLCMPYRHKHKITSPHPK